MKTVNNKVRNALTVFLVIALMVLSKYSFADTTNIKKVSETPVVVKYLGSVNGQDIFQVEIENSLDETIEISFIDIANGANLFEGSFTGKKIVKKFLLDIPESDYQNLQISIRNKKTTQSFTIEKVTNNIKNVVIAKLK